MVQEVSTGKHNILLKEIADSVTSLAVLVDYSEHPKARITKEPKLLTASACDGIRSSSGISCRLLDDLGKRSLDDSYAVSSLGAVDFRTSDPISRDS